MSGETGNLQRAGGECHGATDRSDDRFAWSKEETRDRDDNNVERYIRRLDDIRIPNEPGDEQHVNRELKPRLEENVFGKTKNERVENREAGDHREQPEALVD